jgi:ATP-dependent DNA ligase
VKQRKEYDVVVMGFEEAKATSTKKSGATGDTKYKGMVGAIKFGQFMPTTPEAPLGLKEPFTIPFPTERGMQHAWALRETGKFSGFDDATRKDITENPKKYLHRVVTISAQERLESGHFRHPRFERWREDKAPEECIFRKDEA